MARTRAAFIVSAVTLLFGVCSAALSPAHAAPATTIAPQQKPIAKPFTPPLSQPSWAQLTPQQKQILAPLAKDWDGMESFRRKKWIGIANRYPNMTPEQQARVRTQIKPWANLTPEERNAAREKFKKQHVAPNEQREAKRKKWEEYNALPEAEKRKFRENAARRAPVRQQKTPVAPRPLTHPANAAPTSASPASNTPPPNTTAQ